MSFAGTACTHSAGHRRLFPAGSPKPRLKTFWEGMREESGHIVFWQTMFPRFPVFSESKAGKKKPPCGGFFDQR